MPNEKYKKISVIHDEDMIIWIQRSIRCVYVKDVLETYKPNSTATLVEYKGKKYFVFAYHAYMPQAGIANELALLKNTGDFSEIDPQGLKLFPSLDLAIWPTTTEEGFPFLYFVDLDLHKQASDNLHYEPACIVWIGFPSNQAMPFHKTKINRASECFDKSTSPPKSSAAKYMCIGGVQSKTIDGVAINEKIAFSYSRDNATFIKSGFKKIAPSLEGMSGGAFYKIDGQLFDNNGIPTLKVLQYSLCGIGIEYHHQHAIGVAIESLIQAITTL